MFLDPILGWFSNDLAIDLGTALRWDQETWVSLLSSAGTSLPVGYAPARG